MKEKISNIFGVAFWILWSIGSLIIGTIMLAGAVALIAEKTSGKSSDTD